MDKLHLLPAHQLNVLFCQGELSAEEIVSGYLRRIDTLDELIGAFLNVFHERALRCAKALDAKRARGEKLGKLAAVPIAIKDNIHVKGEVTSCASKFLVNYRAPFNATVTELLEAEDAIIIGKTNLDEFAMGSTTENSALQLTRNPWDLSCTPGGSSGGSAAALAARLCPLALGSDTGGSIRQPAALCGLAGFKPTYGRVSRYGLVAFGSSLDQIGPFAYELKDLALMMEVIGRRCKKDATSLNLPPETYITEADQDLSTCTIGVPWGLFDGLKEQYQKAFSKGVETLKSLGATIIPVELNLLNYATAVYYILATAEASTNLARFDGIRYGVRSTHAKTLDDVYELSKEEGFGPEVKRRILLGTYVLSAGYKDAYYKKAQQVRRLIAEAFQKVFTTCDLIATPVTPTEAFPIGSKKDPLQLYLEDIFTIPANLAGLPAISIPNDLTPAGHPIGLQLVGAQKKDARVISVAYALEQATHHLKNSCAQMLQDSN